MKTAKILVKGEIQKVGFRAKIIEIANNLNIKGQIENLKDSNVEIIAQTENEDKLKEFAEKINIKNTLINVSDVSFEFIETNKVYSNFKKIIKPKEMGERMDDAIAHFKTLIELTKQGIKENKNGFNGISNEIRTGNEKLSNEIRGEIRTGNEKLTNEMKNGNEKLGGKLDNIHNSLNEKLDNIHISLNQNLGIIHNDLSVKQDKTIEILTETKNQTIPRFDKLDNSFHLFHYDTIERFDIVDAKYGKISQNMEKAISSINNVSVNMENIALAILKKHNKK